MLMMLAMKMMKVVISVVSWLVTEYCEPHGVSAG